LQKIAEKGAIYCMTSKESFITITDEAKTEIIRLLENEPETHGLRLGIKGGGCSGLSYELQFTGLDENDTVIEEDGFKVYLDRKSVIYLSGIRLGYNGGLSGRGFVFDNPMASNTCGCGESFSV
jgi:iron-sulfur cluster assembly protein